MPSSKENIGLNDSVGQFYFDTTYAEDFEQQTPTQEDDNDISVLVKKENKQKSSRTFNFSDSVFDDDNNNDDINYDADNDDERYIGGIGISNRNGISSSSHRRDSNTSSYDSQEQRERNKRSMKKKKSSQSILMKLPPIERPILTGTLWYDRIQILRWRCGYFVNNHYVQLIVVLLIAINAIMMGIATFDFIKEDTTRNDAFEITDQIFLIIFTIELCLQFIYHGFYLFIDGWLLFDLIIIIPSWVAPEVQVIRSFRIFRALRLVTRIQVMQNLVVALFSVVPRMFAIALLLLLVSYIFAVMFTQMFKEASQDGLFEYNYFGRIDNTFFTLFQLMTLDNWANVARDVMFEENFKWAWLPFVVFVIISGFVVVNLIIAVICDAISALHDDDKARLHGTFDENSKAEDKLPNIQEQMDSLEQNINELSQMQDQTIQTIIALTKQLAQANRNLSKVSKLNNHNITTDTMITSNNTM